MLLPGYQPAKAKNKPLGFWQKLIGRMTFGNTKCTTYITAMRYSSTDKYVKDVRKSPINWRSETLNAQLSGDNLN